MALALHVDEAEVGGFANVICINMAGMQVVTVRAKDQHPPWMFDAQFRKGIFPFEPGLYDLLLPDGKL